MSLDAESPDVLASGREPDPGRRRRRLVALALLAVVAVVGLGVDRAARQDEYERLVACRTTAFAAVDDAHTATAAMAEYVRPSLSFDTGASNPGLYRMVAEAAGPTLPELGAAENTCAALTVRAWHADQRTGRDALLRFIRAEAALYRATAADGSVYYGPNPGGELRDDARRAVDDARPGLLFV